MSPPVPSGPEAASAITASSPSPAGDTVSLPPHYGVAAGLLLLALACLAAMRLWAGAAVAALGLALFGLALAVQTALLRLEFTDTALKVWRQETLLRAFPYDTWLGWRLFWPGLPVLFYFREQRSIHLLPVLFDAATLRQQLELRLPQLAPKGTPPLPSPPSASSTDG